MSLLFDLKCPILNCIEEQYGQCDTRGCKCELFYCFQHISGQHTGIPNAGVTGNQLLGLENFGNTCYLNSIVQSLVANTTLFRFCNYFDLQLLNLKKYTTYRKFMVPRRNIRYNN